MCGSPMQPKKQKPAPQTQRTAQQHPNHTNRNHLAKTPTNKQEHPSHPTTTKPRTTSTPINYTRHKWYRLSCAKCTIHRVLVTQPKPQKEQENDPHIAARMKHELLHKFMNKIWLAGWAKRPTYFSSQGSLDCLDPFQMPH